MLFAGIVLRESALFRLPLKIRLPPYFPSSSSTNSFRFPRFETSRDESPFLQSASDRVRPPCCRTHCSLSISTTSNGKTSSTNSPFQAQRTTSKQFVWETTKGKREDQVLQFTMTLTWQKKNSTLEAPSTP